MPTWDRVRSVIRDSLDYRRWHDCLEVVHFIAALGDEL